MDSTFNSLEEVARLFTRILLDRQKQEAREPVVLPRDPDTLRELLDLTLPDQGRDLESVGLHLGKLVRHTPTTASGAFFNQLFGGREPASLLGETVAAALNNSMYTYKVGGAQVLVELELIREMGQRVGFDNPDGVFTPGGSLSNLSAMLLARDRARPHVRSEGFSGPRLRVYTSAESHYCVIKASRVLGIGADNVVSVPVDGRGRMRPDALEAAIQADLAAGYEPMMLNATAGTTVLGAFDPLNELADVCEKYDLWMHVDGAFGGSSVLDPDQAHLMAGSHRADSVTWDAHKVMGAQLSCSVILVRQAGLLAASLDENASYLFQGDSLELNPGTRSLQCGRRNDGLKLWTLWQALGNDGLALRLARFRSMTLFAAQIVRDAPDLTLVREPEFLNVCFDVEGVSAEQLCAELTKRGLAMVGYALVDDKAIVRLTLVNGQATNEDVRALFGHIRKVAAELSTAAPSRLAQQVPTR